MNISPTIKKKLFVAAGLTLVLLLTGMLLTRAVIIQPVYQQQIPGQAGADDFCGSDCPNIDIAKPSTFYYDTGWPIGFAGTDGLGGWHIQWYFLLLDIALLYGLSYALTIFVPAVYRKILSQSQKPQTAKTPSSPGSGWGRVLVFVPLGLLVGLITCEVFLVFGAYFGRGTVPAELFSYQSLGVLVLYSGAVIFLVWLYQGIRRADTRLAKNALLGVLLPLILVMVFCILTLMLEFSGGSLFAVYLGVYVVIGFYILAGLVLSIFGIRHLLRNS